MMRFLGALFALGLTGLVILAGVFFYSHWQLNRPGDFAKEQYVIIDSGTSVLEISRILEDKNLLSDQAALLFPYANRIEYPQQTLKAGEYLIKPHASAYEILNLMQSGEIVRRQITIPEGLTSLEIVALVNGLTAISGEPVTKIPPEGSLLPESFAYSRSHTRQKLINRMEKDMRELVDQLWEERAEDLPFDTKEEAVTLASIIEKETGVASERKMVAGVFINRLKKGMPLQTDPTVIYAITEGKSKLDRPLYLKDLKIDHPYNTYLHAGLPPGPIANPGKASLIAALNPAKHDYLYFVADGTGGHAFAETLDEHNKNVAHWRKIRRMQAAE